jgi:hypothetical protein
MFLNARTRREHAPSGISGLRRIRVTPSPSQLCLRRITTMQRGDGMEPAKDKFLPDFGQIY